MKRFTPCILSVLFLFAGALFAQEQVHIIQKGETLYSIGRRYGLSVDEICSYNSISDATKVKAGQQLKIPGKTPGAPQAPQQKTATTDYLVQSGDTFYSLARKHNISVADLLTLNKLGENAVLKSGQKLLVPQTNSASIAPPSVDVPQITLADPRSYENRKISNNVIWPVEPTEVRYSTGKTFSVMLTAKKGEQVTAVKSGLVIFSGMHRGFGQVVFVHSQSSGYIYVYSGLDTVQVAKGQKVTFGETLGTVGLDSISGKAQLNFMVFYNGKPVDPATVPRG